MDLRLKIIDKNNENGSKSKEKFATSESALENVNENEYKLIKSGDLLLEILQDNETSIHAPCGGKGTCKKCTVEIEGFGEVLACQTRLDETLCKKGTDEIVVILPRQGKAKIQSGGKMPEIKIDPLLVMKSNILSTPSIHDQKPDDARIEEDTGFTIPFHLLGNIPSLLRNNQFDLNYIVRNDKNEITTFIDKSNRTKFYGVSIDIGTTTVAAYLYDLSNGKLIKTTSCLNPQRGFGADVISRIDFASKSLENLEQIQYSIGEKILDLLYELSDSIFDIHLISIAGNTTMMHLLCGIEPFAIASAPFIPATLRHQVRYAKEIFPFFPKELKYNPVCILLPSISAYVGADIVAGILTCQMDLDIKPQILIDIGTNGEIALSKNGEIYACSTAAGPAFEGANITCGIGGISGAIDKVHFENNTIKWSTISDEAPIGICGSGIVSAIAALLKSGVIDETGRFEDDVDRINIDLRKRLIEINNEVLFVFAFDEEENPLVYLTQKDIREVQNAKAAVCAGIRLLMETQSLKAKDIENVYIAGGFGNYLNIDDAFAIGLLPSELDGKSKMVGNTSGIGASLCLLNSEMLLRCDKIQKQTKYYELSSDKRFTDLYIDAMMFE